MDLTMQQENNIAAVINDMGPSQKAFYLVKEFNKAIANVQISVSAFFNMAMMPVIHPLFCCNNIAFIANYHGHAISTSLTEADILLKSNTNSVKYLYLWDMDWLTSPVHFTPAMNILRDDRLNIIARSKSHSDIIENFCNKSPMGIVDNWNLDQLVGVIHDNR